MSEVTLEERGAALENQFYDKENREKIAAMKSKLDSQSSREDLRKVSGMTDDAVLDKLVHLPGRIQVIGEVLPSWARAEQIDLLSISWAKMLDDDLLKGLEEQVQRFLAVRDEPLKLREECARKSWSGDLEVFLSRRWLSNFL